MSQPQRRVKAVDTACLPNPSSVQTTGAKENQTSPRGSKLSPIATAHAIHDQRRKSSLTSQLYSP